MLITKKISIFVIGKDPPAEICAVTLSHFNVKLS